MVDLTTAQLKNLEDTLTAALARKRERKKDFFEPYDKQRQFLEAGATHRERMLFAGNQQGKTETGAFETACHLTGDYPPDWTGHKFTHPVRGWAAGETGLLVRDVQQKKLCGTPGVESELGTGFIPKADFHDKPTLARGVTDAFDTVFVVHKTDGVADGISTLSFKSYEQGRTKFQGEPVDFIWLDEECPMDIYTECLARTTATAGIVYTTFTPLKGKTELVNRFLDQYDPQRWHITMTLEDALHITPAMRQAILSQYPLHERDARLRGVPMMGSGRIFPYPDEMVAEPALEHIPPHWTKLWSIDFGIGHPFAATLIAWDRDNDVLHVIEAFKQADALPDRHAQRMKPLGAAVPVAWPQDGTARESTGLPLASQYKKQGLRMLPTHATWPEGGISTEAGILEMQQRIETGRLKVASHLSPWFEEFRNYHRKDGLIVKVHDDIMSATRVGVMAKRSGQAVALGGFYNPARHQGRIAEGLDFDIF